MDFNYNTFNNLFRIKELFLLDVKQINITEKPIHWGDQEYADLLINKKQLQCFTAERIIKLLIWKNNKIKNDKLNITGLNQVLLRKYIK